MSSDLLPASDLQARMTYAQALAASNLLPAQYRKQPANVLVAIEYGNALGLAPMVAIQTIHVVDGKPTASAQLIGGLVRRAGHRLRVTGDATTAVAEIVRSDDPDYTFRAVWTLERAASAGLAGKGSWKAYPEAMLKARAITEVARDACPEVLAGVAYTPEELGAEMHSPETVASMLDTHDDIDDAEIVELHPVDESEPARVEPNHSKLRSPGKWTRKQRLWIEDTIDKIGTEYGYEVGPITLLDILSHVLELELESLDDVAFSDASQVIDNIKHKKASRIHDAFEHYVALRDN